MWSHIRERLSLKHEVHQTKQRLTNLVLVGLIVISTLYMVLFQKIFSIELEHVQTIDVYLTTFKTGTESYVGFAYYLLLERVESRGVIDVLLTTKSLSLGRRVYMLALLTPAANALVCVFWLYKLARGNLSDSNLAIAKGPITLNLVGIVLLTELSNSVYIDQGSIQQRLLVGFFLYTTLLLFVILLLFNLIINNLARKLT